jgi:glucose-6-phosphate 1-dehydrogenase
MKLTFISQTLQHTVKENWVFHYDVPPQLYEDIVKKLKEDFNMRGLLQDHAVVVTIKVKVEKLTNDSQDS